MVKLVAGLCANLTSEYVEALRDSNIRTVLDFVVTEVEDIVRICHSSCRVIVGIRRTLIALFAGNISSCKELYGNALVNTAFFPTGCNDLDNLLEGGILSGEICEIIGSSRTGKTQLCFRMASYAALKYGYGVLLVDAFGTHSANRIHEVIRSLPFSEMERTNALKLITMATCFNAQDLLCIIQQLRNPQVKEGEFPLPQPCRLLIIDSITSILQPLATTSQKGGQGLTNHVANQLKSLTADTNMAVVMTNTMVQWDRGQPRASLGNYWSHVATVHITLSSKSDPDGDTVKPVNEQSIFRVVATITKSNRSATNVKCEFMVN